MTVTQFMDLKSTSPNGRFTLRSVLPGESPAPAFAAEQLESWSIPDLDLQCELTDNRTAKAVWMRNLSDLSESPPKLVEVSDEGWSIVLTHDHFCSQLMLLDPAGDMALTIGIVPENEVIQPEGAMAIWQDSHIDWTPAGPWWTRNSIRYFLKTSEGSYFVWRACWGRRLVVSIPERRLLADAELPRLAPVFADYEAAWVRRTLTNLTSDPAELQHVLDSPQDAEGHDQRAELLDLARAACWLAVDFGCVDCLPMIESLEGIEALGEPSFCGQLGFGSNMHAQSLRPVVQQVIRQLGGHPRCLPAYQFSDASRETLNLSANHLARQGARDWLIASLTARQVLEQLGAPDFIDRQNAWEYDYELESGWRTIRIEWDFVEDDRFSTERMKKMTGQQWKDLMASQDGTDYFISGVSEGPSPWLHDGQRLWEFLRWL